MQNVFFIVALYKEMEGVFEIFLQLHPSRDFSWSSAIAQACQRMYRAPALAIVVVYALSPINFKTHIWILYASKPFITGPMRGWPGLVACWLTPPRWYFAKTSLVGFFSVTCGPPFFLLLMRDAVHQPVLVAHVFSRTNLLATVSWSTTPWDCTGLRSPCAETRGMMRKMTSFSPCRDKFIIIFETTSCRDDKSIARPCVCAFWAS